MFAAHHFQANRYEYKYQITEAQAQMLRPLVRAYLVPDEFARFTPDGSYAIHSLYLDNAEQRLCRATLDGLRNRFKIRIRFYDDKPESPVFLEIKRRVNDAVAKERIAVRRALVPRMLANRDPDPALLWKREPHALATLQDFCRLCEALHADRGMLVSYRREAYVSNTDNSVRVTFDRDVIGGQYDEQLQVRPLADHLQPRINGTILELKFTDRFPAWMRELVLQHNLVRQQMAKYVSCAVALDRMTQCVLGAA